MRFDACRVSLLTKYKCTLNPSQLPGAVASNPGHQPRPKPTTAVWIPIALVGEKFSETIATLFFSKLFGTCL
jgi:hypothetical protein